MLRFRCWSPLALCRYIITPTIQVKQLKIKHHVFLLSGRRFTMKNSTTNPNKVHPWVVMQFTVVIKVKEGLLDFYSKCWKYYFYF
jgi:hypothetical protein